MKKLLIIAAILFATAAQAAPHLVSDPNPGITNYKITGMPASNTSSPTNSPAMTDGSVNLDLATAPIGGNDLTIQACMTDAVWGDTCADPIPFHFTRPAKPLPTKGLRISQ